jgi:uncharacterized protein YcfL
MKSKLCFITLVSFLLLACFSVPTVYAADTIVQLTIPGCAS